MAEKTDKKKIWEGQNRIASEGLEWLYAEPHQKNDESTEEEAYLLGKPVNKVDEKKDRFDDIDAPRQELICKFREDPLFVIKKLEQDQKKLLAKYNALESKSRGSRGRRDSSRDSRRDKRELKSGSESGRGEQKYPQLPRKVNPLEYAFSVNDDIAPPEAIQATAKEREKNATRGNGYYSKSYLNKHRKQDSSPRDYQSKYEELREYGKQHLEKSIKRARYMEECDKRADRDQERGRDANFDEDLKNKMYCRYIDKVERDRRK